MKVDGTGDEIAFKFSLLISFPYPHSIINLATSHMELFPFLQPPEALSRDHKLLRIFCNINIPSTIVLMSFFSNYRAQIKMLSLYETFLFFKK
jgi:hypothetical protein